ncbi:MAG TPA: GatB/YqeY domain-containing protein, partial [Petrotogaceae bacterium]|nr:GatB/YqeY domain-containing protein [Petrotogaceae bacterium]
MLKDLINEDLKCYMKQKNVAALNAVKLLKTDIKKTEVDTMTVLDDEGVVKVLKKQMKMRKESIEQYTAA